VESSFSFIPLDEIFLLFHQGEIQLAEYFTGLLSVFHFPYSSIFQLSDWVLGVGFWVLGVGCWVLGVGCWVLGIGCWVLGVGVW